MVRLRLARFALDLSYTQTKALFRREEFRRKAGLALGHTGYIVGLFEYIMTDMMALRGFAVAGCTMIVGFQLMQPRVQFISVFWNSVFCGVNLYQMHLLCLPEPEPSEDEAALLAALDNRLSVQQLRTLAKAGSWRAFDDGDVVSFSPGRAADPGLADAAEGGTGAPPDAPACKRELYLIASGFFSVRLGPLPLGELGPGSVAGELGSILGEGREAVHIVARGQARCLCLPCDSLEDVLRNDSALQGAVQGIMARSLAAKVCARSRASGALQYSALLEAASGMDDQPAMAAALKRYRQQHGVSEETQRRARELASGERAAWLGKHAYSRAEGAGVGPGRFSAEPAGSETE